MLIAVFLLAAAISNAAAATATSAAGWYRLGVSDLQLHRLTEAKAALNRALALGYDPMSVHYRLASVAAQMHDPTSAVNELDAASAARFIPVEAITADTSFASVASSAPFAAFVDKQKRATHPCRYDLTYHALDFWIGDWSVTSSGVLTGKSHIEATADGCAILEQWTGTFDSGRSISAYDASAKHWTQLYVSGMGKITDYAGIVSADGSLQFLNVRGLAQTVMTYERLSNGSVRQRFKSSTDGGKSWAVSGEYVYMRILK